MFFIQSVFAGETPELKNNSENLCIQCPENILEKPDYSKMMLLNTFVPGSAQLTMGQNNEGYLYMSSIPISLIGQGILLLYFLDRGFVTQPYTENNKNYLIGYSNQNNDKKWMLYTGLTMAIYANLLSSYSSYSAHRDYMDKYNSENSLRKGRESLFELTLSPYKAENVFNWDVMPFFPLSVVAGIQGGDINSVGKYFQRETVPFMGFNVNPVGGLALNLIATVILVTANAAWEEIMYRGLLLETSGITYSSLNFGFAHLGNMLLPDTSVEDTLIQTGFATLFGFYAAHQTEKNNYDFRKMIALHFWHNVTSSTVGYMVNPDKSLFMINCSFKF
jgi:hypothetical protein